MWHKISNKSDNKNISNDTYTVTGRGSYKYIVLLFKLIEQKKNMVFGLLSKIESLVFARNGLKWRVLWLANLLCKSHIWENSHSRDLGQKGPKNGKNRVFGLLRKMPISNTTVKDFENLISYLNSWWNVLSDWCVLFFLYLIPSPLKMGAKLGNIKAQK